MALLKLLGKFLAIPAPGPALNRLGPRGISGAMGPTTIITCAALLAVEWTPGYRAAWCGP
jgi:hypothetical protein